MTRQRVELARNTGVRRVQRGGRSNKLDRGKGLDKRSRKEDKVAMSSGVCLWSSSNKYGADSPIPLRRSSSQEKFEKFKHLGCIFHNFHLIQV